MRTLSATRRRFGFVMSAGIAAVMLFVGTALADEVREFEATIFPHAGDGTTGRMCDGTTVAQPLTLTYTNSEGSTHPTGSVAFTIPSELTIHAVGPAVASLDKSWSVTQDGQVITLVADSPADKLEAGETVSVRVDVTYPEAPTPVTLTIGVMASQSNDPGAGNQFLGNDLAVEVLECNNVGFATCGEDGTAEAGTGRDQSTSTATTGNCTPGEILIVADVVTGGLCVGEQLVVEVLINPTDPGASTTVVTLVDKALIGGNLSAIHVCKNGMDITADAEIVSLPGGVVQVTVTFADGEDPIKGLT